VIKINKQDLDIVNKILDEISRATQENNLPTVINNYDQDKVPKHKDHQSIKDKRDNKKAQLTVG